MLALLILSLSVAAPRMAKDIQRDREMETMQRGKQYIRGHPALLPEIQRLSAEHRCAGEDQHIRFLRKKYVDPTTGKDDWKPIHCGQNKTPTAMGFFGQPLTGTTIAGVGPERRQHGQRRRAERRHWHRDRWQHRQRDWRQQFPVRFERYAGFVDIRYGWAFEFGHRGSGRHWQYRHQAVPAPASAAARTQREAHRPPRARARARACPARPSAGRA